MIPWGRHNQHRLSHSGSVTCSDLEMNLHIVLYNADQFVSCNKHILYNFMYSILYGRNDLGDNLVDFDSVAFSWVLFNISLLCCMCVYRRVCMCVSVYVLMYVYILYVCRLEIHVNWTHCQYSYLRICGWFFPFLVVLFSATCLSFLSCLPETGLDSNAEGWMLMIANFIQSLAYLCFYQR